MATQHQLPIAQLPVDSVAEEDEKSPRKLSGSDHDDNSTLEDGVKGLVSAKSRGTYEMEALEARMNRKWMVLLLGGFLILAYTLSINQYTAGFFLTVALSEGYKAHALQSTVSTVQSVFQAMSQPPIAKAADVFGRVNTYIACVIFYVIGYIIVAASTSIYMYAIGNSIYIIGITGLFLLQNIIISDVTSLRHRLLWTIFPSVPSAINTWVGGDIVASFLGNNGEKNDQWRWGYGMFCILIPVLAMPIIITLWRGTRLSRTERAEYKQGKADNKVPFKQSFMRIFWQLDFIGLVLFVGGFGMLFVTITLANSRTSKWSDAQSICLLVFGALLIAAFVVYERFYAPHPLLPFHLLKNKNVIGCVLIALFHPMAGRIVSGYFTTFLVVAANETYKSAQRISSLPSFAATIVAILAGIITHWTRRLKPVIVLGLVCQTLAFGLMIRFRQSTNTLGEIVVVQLLKGVGIGCISFPVQAVIQSSGKREYLAALTAGYLVVFYMSGGIGSSIGGGIWTNVVPDKIAAYMPGNNETLNNMAYSNPLGFATANPYDTPQRAALAKAQDEAQRLIVIVGTCVSALALITAVVMIDNLRLPDTQSVEDIDGEEPVAGRRAQKEPVAATQ